MGFTFVHTKCEVEITPPLLHQTAPLTGGDRWLNGILIYVILSSIANKVVIEGGRCPSFLTQPFDPCEYAIQYTVHFIWKYLSV